MAENGRFGASASWSRSRQAGCGLAGECGLKPVPRVNDDYFYRLIGLSSVSP